MTARFQYPFKSHYATIDSLQRHVRCQKEMKNNA